MNNIKNSEQNSLDSRSLRDNFKNIKEFMDAENFDGGKSDAAQEQKNRDLRDNFKHIQEFKNARHYEKDDRY